MRWLMIVTSYLCLLIPRLAAADPPPVAPQEEHLHLNLPEQTPGHPPSSLQLHSRFGLITYASYGAVFAETEHGMEMNDSFEFLTEGVWRFGPHRDLGLGLVIGGGSHPLNGLYDVTTMVAFQMDLIYPLEILVMGGVDTCLYPEVRITWRITLHSSLAHFRVAPALIVTTDIAMDGRMHQELMVGANLRVSARNRLYILSHLSSPTLNRPTGGNVGAHDEEHWAGGLTIMHTHDFL